jgi:hypothetical protein
MVIKATLLHSGWSYGNGDDQYDNEYIGTSRKEFNLKKSIENSSSNKKNGGAEIMCNRNKDKHTDEDGWTTIDAHNNRKPKKKNKKQTLIESNKSAINVGPKIDRKKDPEAQIETSIRENKYTSTEEITKQEEEEIKNEEQRKQKQKQKAALPTGKQAEQKSATQTKTRGMAENKEYGKVNKNTKPRDNTRGNNRQENGRKDKKQEYERKLEITTTSKQRRRKQGCK